MRPVAFDYRRAESLEHALSLVAEYGYDATPLAGGQSLVPMMNLRYARPEVLIDINRIGCDEIAVEPGEIKLGALVRHRAVLEHPDIHRAAPVIREAYRHLAHPVIRQRGTAGGSVAYADPTAEIPALLMLLDGRITLDSTAGERSVEAADFFRSAFTTAIEPTELVTGLAFRLPAGPWGGAFDELAERHGDYAIAGAAAAVAVANGRIGEARIVVSGAASTPIRVPELEAMLRGEALTPALARSVGREAAGLFEGYSDVRASAAYRKRALGVLVERTLLSAHARSGGGEA